MASIARHIHSNTQATSRRPAGGLLVLPLVMFFALAFVALGYVAYVLWPRWPEAPVAANAPSLPIVISGVLFHVPPAAMRVPMQRRAGAHERIDLVYLWPSLAPPDPTAKWGSNGASGRVFVTISVAAGTLPPGERFKTIYPRHIAAEPLAGPDGLTLFAFRTGTPYQGEDLFFDHAAPENFSVRCSRDGRGPTPGTCLYERRIGEADIVMRFPRQWLNDWRNLAAGLERLIGQLRASGAK